MKLSSNLRKWLIIGGGSVIGLLLVCLITYVVMGPGALHSTALSNGDFYAPQEAATEAPALGLAGEQASRAAAAQSAPMPDAAGGYGGGPADGSGFVTDNLAAAPTAVAALASDQQQAQQRLIVRNGTVNISVENTYASEKSIEAMIDQMSTDGAFVVSTNESPTGYGVSPYITMVIRVPAKNFDAIIDAIAKLAAKGTTPTLTKNADDVTSQYVDVSARLAALEAARDRLQQIMSEAQNTNDLLQAEQQLTQREAEIDALKGQKQFLEQSAALSSITVTLTPYVLSQPVDSSWRPLETVREAFDRLVGSLRGFGDFLIIFIISVVPWLLVAGLVVFAIVRFVQSRVRRARTRNAGAGSDEG